MSAETVWAVSAHAGKADHLDPLVRTLSENNGEYG